MLSTVNNGFNDFLSKLVPSSSERSAATQHRASVIAKLEDSFGVSNSFETGSLGNGTAISHYADLDVFASIPQYSQRNNSATMLGVARDALKERFPYSNIVVRTPAVRCSFGGANREIVEIVPAYYREQSSDGYNIYIIPDFNGEWQVSSPGAHNKYVREMNGKFNGKVKPLVRFIKAVKYYNNIPVSSFYLEMRVAKWCDNQGYIDYSQDVKSILRFLADNALSSLQDPVGVSGYINACSTTALKEDAISKFKTAATRAENAWACENRGDIDKACYWWNMVFDDKFS